MFLVVFLMFLVVFLMFLVVFPVFFLIFLGILVVFHGKNGPFRHEKANFMIVQRFALGRAKRKTKKC